MIMLQHQTYLSECLKNFRDAKRARENFEKWKKDYPENFKDTRMQVVARFRERIENAFNELLQQEDFREYLKKFVLKNTAQVIPIEKSNPITQHLVGERYVLAIVQTPLENLEIQIGLIDSHGDFHKTDFITDEEFMQTLRRCGDSDVYACEMLVSEIVDCFGEE